jgi:Zn-dependent protease
VLGHRFELFRLLGARVLVDASWLPLAGFLAFAYALQIFPLAAPRLPAATYWAMAVALLLGLIASLLVREVARLALARHYRFRIATVTLLLFGSLLEGEEPPHAEADFLFAAAGPATTFWWTGCLLLTFLYGGVAGWPPAWVTVLAHLAFLNGAIALLHLVPAFPLDGGRLARALLWVFKGDFRSAVQVASSLAMGLGVGLILLGFVLAFVGPMPLGLLCASLGFFVRLSSRASYQTGLLRKTLGQQPVSQFMDVQPTVIQRAISIQQLVEEHLAKHPHNLYPVVDGDRLLGAVSVERVRRVPRDDWDRQTVGTLVERQGPTNAVAPSTPAVEALAVMSQNHVNRVLVVHDEQLVGVLDLDQLLARGNRAAG